MPEALIRGLTCDAAAGSDMIIAEGVMGLFDGAAGNGRLGRGATADIAALLGWPVLLVLDITGQTETAAAVALGCASYRDDVAIAGVILNRAASARHAGLVQPAFARIGIPVLGALPRDETLALPDRHLGLVQAAEHDALPAQLDRLAGAIAAAVDLGAILAAAQRGCGAPAGVTGIPAGHCGIAPPGQCIAVAQDRAFSFLYPHLVGAWRAVGAEIVPFSPLADEPPDAAADAVWLPGGYP